MRLTLAIAEKLHRLAAGERLPASQMKHALVDELISEGIVLQQISGRTKSTLYIEHKPSLDNWLFNKFSIDDLESYIAILKNEEASRADLVQAASDSKTLNRRTFKGFMVNSYAPIACTLNGQPFEVAPTRGTFQFIYDYEHFVPAADVVIVGIENAENFRWVEQQQHLFGGLKTLFVSRYPQEQSKDLMKWLLGIPNAYLHFGDYDFAGINIYLQEYKKHLGERASLFIPHNIGALLEKYGNKNLYDQQQLNNLVITEEKVVGLVALLHRYKKGLEQEGLMEASTIIIRSI